MKKLSLFCAAIATSAALSGVASAQEYKIGYVSLDRLMAESAPAKSARAALDSQFKSRETALDAKAAGIRAKQQAYEKDFPSLSDAKRADREKELTQTIDAFEADRAKFEEDLSNAQNKVLQDLLTKANQVIKELAVKKGYRYVTQEAVYISPEDDLTSQVIDLLH